MLRCLFEPRKKKAKKKIHSRSSHKTGFCETLRRRQFSILFRRTKLIPKYLEYYGTLNWKDFLNDSNVELLLHFKSLYYYWAMFANKTFVPMEVKAWNYANFTTKGTSRKSYNCIMYRHINFRLARTFSIISQLDLLERIFDQHVLSEPHFSYPILNIPCGRRSSSAFVQYFDFKEFNECKQNRLPAFKYQKSLTGASCEHKNLSFTSLVDPWKGIKRFNDIILMSSGVSLKLTTHKNSLSISSKTLIYQF